jgi:hypothetical protein
VEADKGLENFVSAEVRSFLIDFRLQMIDAFFNFGVIFLHGLVEADDRFGDFFLEIREKPLNDGEHLALSFPNPFGEIFLFFNFLKLMFLHVDSVVVKFLDSFLEEAAEIADDLVDAEC